MPDGETKRVLKACFRSGPMVVSPSRGQTDIPSIKQFSVFSAGVLLGAVLHLAAAVGQSRDFSEPGVRSLSGIRYAPPLIGAGLLYLAVLIAGKRLRGKDLYISLGLVGFGAVYLSDLFFLHH